MNEYITTRTVALIPILSKLLLLLLFSLLFIGTASATVVTLLPNSSGSVGWYGALGTELKYPTDVCNFGTSGTNYTCPGIYGTRNPISQAGLDSMSSINGLTFYNSLGTSSLDAWNYVNLTKTDVLSVNSIMITTLFRKTIAGDDGITGLYNITNSPYTNFGGGWTKTGNIGTTDTVLHYSNFTLDNASEKATYINLTGTTLTFSVAIWTNGGGAADTYIDFINATVDYEPYVPVTYIPPTPISCSATTGNFWSNTSCSAGSGNATNAMNKSVNGIWYNTSVFYYLSSLSPHGWQNVSYFAWNNTNGGLLNSTPATLNTQIPNNVPVMNIGAKSVNEGACANFTLSSYTVDADGDSITYAKNGSSKGSLNGAAYSYCPDYTESGTYYVNFTGNDSYSGSDYEVVTFTVNDITLSIDSYSPSNNFSSYTGVSQSFSIGTTKPATIYWNINGSLIETDTSTMSASYINSSGQTGIYNITVYANDGTNNVSHSWIWSVVPQELRFQVKNSSTIQVSNDTEYVVSAVSYANYNNITTTQNIAGIVNISFDMRTVVDTQPAYGRIYKNGVAVGTERTTTSNVYQTFSENLSITLDSTDILELWSHNDGVSSRVRNFRLSYDYVPASIITSPVNNSAQTSRVVNITWNGTSPFQYQVSPVSDFSTFLFNVSMVNNYSSNLTLPIGLNYIRVRGYNASENSATNWSNSTNIKIMSNIYDINTSGLVGWWHFDDNLTDVSGRNHNGTFGGGYLNYQSGHFNNGILFNGSNDIVLMNISSDFNFTSGTLSAWIKTPDATATGSIYPMIVDKPSAWDMSMDGNYFGLYDWGSASYRNSTAKLNDSTWHHIAITFINDTDNGLTFYVDGVLKTTSKVTFPALAENVTIGGWKDWTGEAFAGNIDEVLIYNRTLLSNEVRQLYYNYTMDNGYPNITSQSNSRTNTGEVNLTVPLGTNATFSVVVNHPLTGHNWYGATNITGLVAYKVFSSIGNEAVTYFGQNDNGSTQTVMWNISVVDINYTSPTILNSTQTWNVNSTEVRIIYPSGYVTNATLNTRLRMGASGLKYHDTQSYDMSSINSTLLTYNLTNLEDGQYRYTVFVNLSDGTNYTLPERYVNISLGFFGNGSGINAQLGDLVYLHQNNSNQKYRTSLTNEFAGWKLIEYEFELFYRSPTSDFITVYNCYNNSDDYYYDDVSCTGGDTNITLGVIYNGSYNPYVVSLDRYSKSATDYITITNPGRSAPSGYSFNKHLGYVIPSGALADDMVFINNSFIKVGFNKRFGGAIYNISKLSDSTSQNLVLSWGCGGQIQQSYYEGDKPSIGYAPNYVLDKSSDNGTNTYNMDWNPLQSGSIYCQPSTVHDYQITNSTATFNVSLNNWNPSNGNKLYSQFDAIFEYSLDEDRPVINIRSFAINNGTGQIYNFTEPTSLQHPAILEFPATFLIRNYSVLTMRNSTQLLNLTGLNESQFYGIWDDIYEDQPIYMVARNGSNLSDSVGVWNWGRPQYSVMIGNETGTKTQHPEYDTTQMYIAAHPAWSGLNNPYRDSMTGGFGIYGTQIHQEGKLYIGDFDTLDTFFQQQDSTIQFNENGNPVNATLVTTPVNRTVAGNFSVSVWTWNNILNTTLSWTNSTGTYQLPMIVAPDNLSAEIYMMGLTEFNYTYYVSAFFGNGFNDTTETVWTNVSFIPSSITNLSVNAVIGTKNIIYSWDNPTSSYFDYIYITDQTGMQLHDNITNVTNSTTMAFTIWHEVTNVSFQTVGTTGNINTTRVWGNATIQNNPINISLIEPQTIVTGQNLTVYAEVLSTTNIDGDNVTWNDNATQFQIAEVPNIYNEWQSEEGRLAKANWLTTSGDIGNYTFNINVTNSTYGDFNQTNFSLSVIAIPTGTMQVTNSTTLQRANNMTRRAISETPFNLSSLQLLKNVTGSINISYSGFWNGMKTIVQKNGVNITTEYTDVIGGWDVHTETISGTFYYTDVFTLQVWSDGSSNIIRNFQISYDEQGLLPTEFIPPSPVWVSNTTGLYWVNHTWQDGSGNITDSYNVSHNGTWANNSVATFFNASLNPSGWSNITIWAWNNSGTGTLSPTSISNNSQAPAVPASNGTPNITAWYNTINGWNQTAMSINAGNSATFNITVNQTITNVSWNVSGTEEQNTSSLQFTRAFNTLGDFNVTAQAFNENGSSNIIYTVVTVTTTGGGGTDWDFAYGWVNWSNGTVVNNAAVATSKGTEYTDVNGYYSFGYVFEHGQQYNFNISRYNIWDNKTISFSSGDYQIVNGTLQAPAGANQPNITSWGNDNTSNSNITLNVPKYTNITFNVTVNQSVTTTWTGTASPIKINGTNENISFAYKNFTNAGIFTIIASCSNVNGSCLNSVTWMVTVTGIGGLTLSGYVNNILDANITGARIDLGETYVFTNSTGNYAFTDVPEGTYSVLARAIGYINNTNTSEITNDTIMNFIMIEKETGDSTTYSVISPISLLLGVLGGIIGARYMWSKGSR